ncbi:thrombospondin type 3 repeat-containing protein [Nanoarchaeota archaeon]
MVKRLIAFSVFVLLGISMFSVGVVAQQQDNSCGLGCMIVDFFKSLFGGASLNVTGSFIEGDDSYGYGYGYGGGPCDDYSNTLYISNCCELQLMKENLFGDYVLVNDIMCSETADWNNGAGFEPIGIRVASSPDRVGAFKGSFDGNNFNIIGLHINRPTESYVGLFGGVYESAWIKDVSFLDVNVVGGNVVGALAGQVDEASVSNVHSTGSVTGLVSVGGLIGSLYLAQSPDSSVSSSSTAGTVDGFRIVGGLIGGSYKSRIFESFSAADVTAELDHVGGLLSDGRETLISDSYATGSVTGISAVGGLASSVTSIINSYATGTVTGDADGVGGLVAYISNFGIYNYLVEDSYATGSVTGSGNYVGGLIGKVPSNFLITNSYWYNNQAQCIGSSGTPGECTLATSEDYFYNKCDNGPMTSWDYTTIWGEKDSSPYSCLLWEAGCELLECVTCIDPDNDGYGEGPGCLGPDNCPTVSNADQADSDTDALGNACDNCDYVANADQANVDGDSFGNACDNCVEDYNPDQADADGDLVGNVCDNCPNVANLNQADTDFDTVGNICDNCPNVANLNQADSDEGSGQFLRSGVISDSYSNNLYSFEFCGETDLRSHLITFTSGSLYGQTFEVEPFAASHEGGCHKTGDTGIVALVEGPNVDSTGFTFDIYAPRIPDGVGDACDNCVDVANTNQADVDRTCPANEVENCNSLTEEQCNSKDYYFDDNFGTLYVCGSYGGYGCGSFAHCTLGDGAGDVCDCDDEICTEEPICTADPACCTPSPGGEVCNGVDDDCDDIVDADDEDFISCGTDGWEDTEVTQTVLVGPCNEQEQKQQVYKDYICNAAAGCTIETGALRWVDVGELIIKDQDEDNVCDGVDKCTNLDLPGVPATFLGAKPNHVALDAQVAFGCTCEEVLYCKPGANNGEFKFGCAPGTVNIWEIQNGWTPDCQTNGVVTQAGEAKSLFEDSDGAGVIDLFDTDNDNDGVSDGSDALMDDADPVGSVGRGKPDWWEKKHPGK